MSNGTIKLLGETDEAMLEGRPVFVVIPDDSKTLARPRTTSSVRI